MAHETLTYSTELMRNYKQAEVMSPEKKMEALQSCEGNALLFSIGTDDVFYVTQESPGHATGWEKTDLSSALIGRDFSEDAHAACKSFEVAQNPKDGTIGIAIVIDDGKQDHLYLCLGNSCSDLRWLSGPLWQACPYDDPDHPLSSVIIANVYIDETSQGVQYIVADTLRDPKSAEKLVYRHYIDTKRSGGYRWHPHDMAFDIESDGYVSCLGRQAGQYVDGLYTFGTVDGHVQFAYQPLYNVWNPAIPPSPARLNLPGGLSPEAMAPLRNSDLSSDLYVGASGGIYRFASTDQRDGDTGVLVCSNPLFNGLKKLFAYNANGSVILWGLNGDDQIFYTAAPLQRVSDPSAWSYPLPLLERVDMVSPYVNRVDNGNTFFAVTGDRLTVATQSTASTTWSFNSVMLPAPINAKATKYDSYTTRLQLKDGDDQPLVNAAVTITAPARTAVYINHLYYVLGPTPVTVKSDQLGSITVMQFVEGLQAARLTVTANGTTVDINPMDKAFNKAVGLDSAQKLKDAKITAPDGTTTPLISDSVTSENLNAVAQNNTQLSKAYASKASDAMMTMVPAHLTPALAAHAHARVMVLRSSFGDDILVAAGDLFNWLKSGVESIIHIVEDAATGLWHFIAKIGDKVYRAVLDTVETIVGAVEWVFKAIMTLVKDLIAFLEFLFEWNDITRTQQVIKNLTHLFLHHQVDEIEVVKKAFDGMMEDLVKSINGWAGITDWQGLGSAANAPLDSSSTPTVGLSSPSTLLSHHFQNNAGHIDQTNPPAPPNPRQNPIDVLLSALKNEGEILSEVLEQFETLAKDSATLSLTQILQRIVAIIADGVIESAENVINALFDILYDITSIALEVLETPVHIPVVSDILNDFGVKDISMLDLFCWITALPVTIGYKLLTGNTPFPDNDETKFLIHATSYEQVCNAFDASASHEPQMLLAAQAPAAQGALALSDSVKSAVFITGHTASGFFTLMNAFVAPFEAAEETGENPFAVPSAVLGILSGVSDGVATTLAPRYPIQNSAVAWVNRVTLGIRILAKVIFSGPAQSRFGASEGVMSILKVGDGRATGSVVDAVLTIPAFACSCWHFGELCTIKPDKAWSQSIVEETAQLSSYISRISYMVAVNGEDPRVKAVAVVVMEVANVCYSGLETAESVIEASVT